jgi:hypothetical protein
VEKMQCPKLDLKCQFSRNYSSKCAHNQNLTCVHRKS